MPRPMSVANRESAYDQKLSISKLFRYLSEYQACASLVDLTSPRVTYLLAASNFVAVPPP